ncbi:MAG: hypothetical protein WCW36_03140 [Candidatus Paceibacterota bacterium]|jgi:hypothetical protein
MENITVVFDVVIAFTSLWVLSKLVGYGGVIGDSLAKVGYGIVFIGFSQIVETIGLVLFDSNIFDVHFINRSLLIIGFIFVSWGFKNLMGEK